MLVFSCTWGGADATCEQAGAISLAAFTGYKYVKLSLKRGCSFCLSLQEVSVGQAGSEHPFSSLLCHAVSLSERLSVKPHCPAESS